MTQISSVLKGAFCPRRLLGPTIAVLIDERNRVHNVVGGLLR